MILLYNPKATRFRNRRLFLSVLSIAAVLEGKEEYAIVDGNLDPHPTETLVTLLKEHPVELLAVTVMPGPQTVGAVGTCREIRARFPNVPIVWEGYFPSNYTAATLSVAYVDYAVSGQGEQTFLELLDAIRGNRDLKPVLGVSYKASAGAVCYNPERQMRSPGGLHWCPYHRAARGAIPLAYLSGLVGGVRAGATSL
jgi:anaerobic magnesium-protoporphyrin IX monomethyl ester cyclase